LTAAQRQCLLRLARSSVEAACRQLDLGPLNPGDLEAPLLELRACFVTLEMHSRLRGCIGHLIPQKPLYEAVVEAARQAALADPRFAPVQPNELPDITIEISLLSPVTPLTYRSTADLLSQLQPHRHGVVLQFEDRTSTFLPQVWEQMPDKITFLDHLAVKGGWQPHAWRDAHAHLSVYEVECFHEPVTPS
jgi:AmmeMemoRadiSam system protein A